MIITIVDSDYNDWLKPLYALSWNYYIPEIWKFRWYYVLVAPFCKKIQKRKLYIDLKWPPFWKKEIKKKVAYWSEMGSNAIKSDFRSSKMPAGGHFEKHNLKREKLRFDLKWPVMRIKVIFAHPKWPPAKKIKSCLLIWNGEKCDQKWFSIFQNGRRQPFCENKKKLRIDLKWREMR